MGLSTVIGTENIDATGKPLPNNTKNKFNYLRFLDSRSKLRPIDIRIISAFVLLDTLKTKLAIPDLVIEDAAYIFRKAMRLKMARGRTINVVVCASLYTACRQADIPRTICDIAQTANIKKKKISRCYLDLAKALGLSIKPFEPSKFINRISCMIGIDEKTRRDAINILSQVVQKEISVGKNPVALAASVLYLACTNNGKRKTPNEIAGASGVCEDTIRDTIILLE